jgi:arabinofuranosyltransferase
MSKWRPSWTTLLITVLALVARLVSGPRIIDDAYITFRYAQNLVSGMGLVYNPGEHVLGTTTPLYTFLLALLSIPFGGATAPFPI